MNQIDNLLVERFKESHPEEIKLGYFEVLNKIFTKMKMELFKKEELGSKRLKQTQEEIFSFLKNFGLVKSDDESRIVLDDLIDREIQLTPISTIDGWDLANYGIKVFLLTSHYKKKKNIMKYMGKIIYQYF